ncbi:hypothetical protein [Aestuariispira insulae]|uniref:FlaG protein n=1 Tax=Aestuariispira insulae TaxID=1461337 RepID=A0A3D9HSJ7_9PROT|nr:hypothetical protein [Aestuariispira insulae]RED52430.1 hypothetical protein DFP90_102451 [Aestuariispira insulae]
MEVNLPPQVTLPQNATQNQNHGSTAEAGATQTLQKTPDHVVTATTQGAETNVRDEDALRRESRADQDLAPPTFDSLKVNGLKTRVGYDNVQETVYLEILQPNTDEVLSRIPSEELLEYLANQVEQVSGDEKTAQTNA